MDIKKLTAVDYNNKGDAIAFFNNKVFYVRGLIKGEKAKCLIVKEFEKWGIAQIIQIISFSEDRVYNLPENHLQVGGYELLHLSYQAQLQFKEELIRKDFLQNAKYSLVQEKIVESPKKLRYRNKITLHDGHFHSRESNEPIGIEDFLLTDIKPTTNLKGEVIIRKLDTQIEGNSADDLYTTDTLLGLKFWIKLNAFYQINKEVAEIIYSKILTFIKPEDEVLDLFSGIGTITLTISKRAQKVWGVEGNRGSHKSALLNKKNNKITNVEFFNDDVLSFLSRTKLRPSVVIVDPARNGLKKKVCEAILALQPSRIIYLSCNPATQAADFANLKENYKIVYSQGFDMFPQTHHVENLVILDKI